MLILVLVSLLFYIPFFKVPNDKLVVVANREVDSKPEAVVLLVDEEVRTGSTNSRMVSYPKPVEKVLPNWLWEVVAKRAMLAAASGVTAARTASWTACRLWRWAASGR